MQNDIVSTFAVEVLPTLRAVTPSAEAAAAHALLRDWDGRMAAEAPQPLLFHAWLRAFRRAALSAGGALAAEDQAGPEFLRGLLHPDGRGAAWCGPDRCAALLTRSLDDAVRGLVADQGRDPAAWRWDRVHVARFDHPLLRVLPVLRDLTQLEAPTPGDGETISRGTFRGAGPTPYAHIQGAGLRAVFDLSDPDGVLAIVATGQSGHPLSDLYGNMLQRWRDGDVVRLGRVPDREAGRIGLTP
jgi:penicillin amidase